MVRRSVTRLLVAAAVVMSGVLPANAALITFNTRAAFNGAAPGLPVETFEAGLVTPAGLAICDGPLSNSTANACFAAGGLLPGVTYSAAPIGRVVVLGAGFGGIPISSKVMGPNAFGDTLNLTFVAANAVGLDVFAGPGPGNVVLSVFSPANTLLGNFTVAAAASGSFFGVISDTGPIGRLNVASQASTPGELIDNVAFGTRATSVPEPASIVLLGIGLGFAARRRPRKRSRPAGTVLLTETHGAEAGRKYRRDERCECRTVRTAW